MILPKKMTYEEWQDLKIRTETALDVDVKDYYSLVNILNEWTSSRTILEQFRMGDPQRYINRLKDVLTRFKNTVPYPALVDTNGKPEKIKIAQIPYRSTEQMPVPLAQESKPKATIPANWSRFASFDSYKNLLPESLRTEGENYLVAWFANRTRLHDTAKELVRRQASQQSIADVVAKLDDQNNAIQNYFDRVEKFMKTGEDPSEVKELNKPSGKFTKAQIDQMTDPMFAAECKVLRREANIRYLSRRDINNPMEVELRKNELKEWGFDVESLMRKKNEKAK